jgi:hypothetical protein
MQEPPAVRLSLPAESRYVRLARLTAASVGDDAGFDIDGIEDLRIAVNEMYALLIEGSEDPAGEVQLTFRLTGDGVEVEGLRAGVPATDGPELLAREILAVVVDDHSFDHDGTNRRFHLRKRVSAPA